MTDSVLNCPVPIQQIDAEFLVLLDEYKNLTPRKKVLEIGSFNGGSLWFWIQYSELYSNIVAVDNTITYEKANLWHDWCRDKDVGLTLMNMMSNDSRILDVIKGMKFDFMFIDGGHDFETVEYDFNTFFPFLRSGGILSLHDINNAGYPAFGVKKLWDIIKKSGYKTKEIITMKEQVGGIGIVYA